MKLRDSILLATIALLLAGHHPSLASGVAKIDTQLQAVLDSTAEEDFVDVILMVSNGDRISAETSVLARKQDKFAGRYLAAHGQLHKKTASAQAELVQLLQDRVAAGVVAEFKPYWIANMIYLRARPDEIRQLADHADVAEIVSDLPVELIEPVAQAAAKVAQVGAAENLVAVGARTLWNKGLTGSGRLICSFDTGVLGSHPALQAKWRGNFTSDTAACWFDPYGTKFPHDDIGHGTHVMGIMVGHDGADTIGLAPDAQWICAAVIDRGKTLPQTMSDILDAFQWAADPDGNPETLDDVPDVVCNAWGIPAGFMQSCDQMFWEPIDNLESLGIVCIFAAGNEGPNSMTIRNPSTRTTSLTNTFSVGSVDATDLELPVASFSSRGPSPCNFADKKPEVVAPGVSIRSSFKDGDYKLISGTSMSAPHVAAAVALFRQYNPDLTPDQIKEAILLSAVDVDSPGEDNESGMGFVNLAAALDLLPKPATSEPRIIDITFADGANNLADPGESGNLVITLRGEIADGVDVVGRLTTAESGVTISKDSASFGDLPIGEERDNGNDPFVVSTIASFTVGDTVDFTLILSGDDFPAPVSRDFSLVFGVPYNGQWNTLDFGAVRMTVSNFGILGLHDESYVPLGGAGYNVAAAGGNYLYEAGLVLTSDDKVSDGIRNGSAGKYDGDFTPLRSATMTPFVPGVVGDQELDAEFADNAAENPLGVAVRQRAAAFGVAPGDRCILIEYTLFNITEIEIQGLRVGLFSDWDFPGGTDAEFVTVDPVEDLFYEYRGSSGPVVGVAALNVPLSSARFFDNGTGKRGFSDEEKMTALAGPVESPNAGTAADWCGFVAAGPYDLDAGDSVIVTFALCWGESVAEFYATAAAARNRYSIATGITDEETNQPQEYELVLHQNYPNPFNAETRIDFAVAADGPVEIAVYDILGRKISILYDGWCPAGNHSVMWQGTDGSGRPVASGIYLTRMSSSTDSVTRKMTLLK